MHVYEFGPFHLDATERLLLRDGRTVPLPPKAINLLLLLVERSGRVVEKDELMNKIWSDRAIEDNNLTVTMSLLRKALGSGLAGEHSYIETIPRRGYRFVAEVREVKGGDERKA